MSAFIGSPGTKFQPFSVVFTSMNAKEEDTNSAWSSHFQQLIDGMGLALRYHTMGVREFLALNSICNQREFDLTTYLSGRQGPEAMKEYEGLDTDIELRVLGKRSTKELHYFEHFQLALQVIMSAILSRQVDEEYVLRCSSLKEEDFGGILNVQMETLGFFVVDIPSLCGMRDFLRVDNGRPKLVKDRDCSFLLGDSGKSSSFRKWTPEIGKEISSKTDEMAYVAYTVIPLYDGSFLDKSNVEEIYVTAWVTRAIVSGIATKKEDDSTFRGVYYEWAHFDRRLDNCLSYRLHAGTTLIVPASTVVSFKGSLVHNVRVFGSVMKAWTTSKQKEIILQHKWDNIEESCERKKLFFGSTYPKPKSKDLKKMNSTWLENVRMSVGAVPSLKSLHPMCTNRQQSLNVIEETLDSTCTSLGEILKNNPTIVVRQNRKTTFKHGELEAQDGWLVEGIPYARLFQCSQRSDTAHHELNLSDVNFNALRTKRPPGVEDMESDSDINEDVSDSSQSEKRKMEDGKTPINKIGDQMKAIRNDYKKGISISKSDVLIGEAPPTPEKKYSRNIESDKIQPNLTQDVDENNIAQSQENENEKEKIDADRIRKAITESQQKNLTEKDEKKKKVSVVHLKKAVSVFDRDNKRGREVSAAKNSTESFLLKKQKKN